MIKITDLVYCTNRKLFGQIARIRNGFVTMFFVTGEKVKKNKKDIYNVDNQWRMNG